MARTLTAAALLLACAACASGPKGTPSLPSRDAPPAEALRGVRRDPNRISMEEIRATQGVLNAYELIRALRPRWYRTVLIGSNTRSSVRVEVDGTDVGSTFALSEIPVDAITGLEFKDKFDATQRHAGNQALAGTIIVSTVRRQ